MDKKMRFKKQELNSEDYKGMEQGAKALKGALGAITAVAVLFKNRQNLKALGEGTLKIAGQLLKK